MAAWPPTTEREEKKGGEKKMRNEKFLGTSGQSVCVFLYAYVDDSSVQTSGVGAFGVGELIQVAHAVGHGQHGLGVRFTLFTL